MGQREVLTVHALSVLSCPTSLYVTHRMLTMTVVSVNRLPALLLGLRYKQVVTTESTSIILAAAWAL